MPLKRTPAQTDTRTRWPLSPPHLPHHPSLLKPTADLARHGAISGSAIRARARGLSAGRGGVEEPGAAGRRSRVDGAFERGQPRRSSAGKASRTHRGPGESIPTGSSGPPGRRTSRRARRSAQARARLAGKPRERFRRNLAASTDLTTLAEQAELDFRAATAADRPARAAAALDVHRRLAASLGDFRIESEPIPRFASCTRGWGDMDWTQANPRLLFAISPASSSPNPMTLKRCGSPVWRTVARATPIAHWNAWREILAPCAR